MTVYWEILNSYYLIMGRVGSRMISVAVSKQEAGVYYPVTARDSAKKERKIIYKRELEILKV